LTPTGICILHSPSISELRDELPRSSHNGGILVMASMAALALPALIIGTGTSAFGQLSAAGQQSAAAEFESQQYAQQAQAQQTAGIQEETARRRDLTSNLETIQSGNPRRPWRRCGFADRDVDLRFRHQQIGR
jgi:uncharacterized protein HemX